MKISATLAAALSLVIINHALLSQPASPEFCIAILPGADGGTVTNSSLSWDRRKVEFDAPLGQSIVRTSYRFTNSSKSPVSLIDLATSCGCVATEVEKLDFQPGESGEIKVTLDLAMDPEILLQDRVVIVSTSDAPKSPTMLRLIVRVPTAVETSSKDVAWTVGEKISAKHVLISPGPGVKDLKLTKRSENGDFSVEINPEPTEGNYRVSITPTSTATQTCAQIRFEVESTSFERPLACAINANVKDL